MELIVQLGLLHGPGNGVENEAMRGLAGALSRCRDSLFQIVVDSDGGRRHEERLLATKI
jgi:NAD(P)H-hydrate repair Nnr-like enzyme with NAD(P)H-hydrate dehydratase domain